MASQASPQDLAPRGPHVVVSLPTRDLARAFRFYREGLGFRLVAEPADGSMPEPVHFSLNAGVSLMLIPTGGFGWVAGGNTVAEQGVSECILSLSLATEAEVDAFVAKARAAGAGIPSEPGRKPWGYSGTFKDPDGHVWMLEKVG
ncbi:VOC family protein [Corallococcus macrosporus]|uniref:Glyoxalase n=1 Tax=Corallococcus macrosporus DSM 14697 TaxID=1189310 RepID=A0A250JYY3_9BACT|nr:VOC family protein [Corallococcus macrosporus]ATB48707.1 glyoxalase [Corallococcus macrosporus DSM 14697]